MSAGSRRIEFHRSGEELEIQFGFELLQFLLFLGGFARLDQLAKRAGVLAVESFLQRRGEGVRLGKLHGHADPGDGLEQCPVPADDHHQRQHHETFARPTEHARNLRARRYGVNRRADFRASLD